METRDLALAAALISTGHRLEAVFSEGNHAIFRFAHSPKLDRAVSAFYARQFQIDAASFGEAMRSAKSAAMAARRQPVGAGT